MPWRSALALLAGCARQGRAAQAASRRWWASSPCEPTTVPIDVELPGRTAPLLDLRSAAAGERASCSSGCSPRARTSAPGAAALPDRCGGSTGPQVGQAQGNLAIGAGQRGDGAGSSARSAIRRPGEDPCGRPPGCRRRPRHRWPGGSHDQADQHPRSTPHASTWAITTVRAPISGTIGRSLITVGALVTRRAQTDPLATIQTLDPMFVDIQQSSSQLLALQARR